MGTRKLLKAIEPSKAHVMQIEVQYAFRPSDTASTPLSRMSSSQSLATLSVPEGTDPILLSRWMIPSRNPDAAIRAGVSAEWDRHSCSVRSSVLRACDSLHIQCISYCTYGEQGWERATGKGWEQGAIAVQPSKARRSGSG